MDKETGQKRNVWVGDHLLTGYYIVVIASDANQGVHKACDFMAKEGSRE